MTQAIGTHLEALKAAMTGAVVTPDELDYEQARKVWNADIDRRPAVIALCTTARDVAEAILFGQ